jgi:hypothetical protein
MEVKDIVRTTHADVTTRPQLDSSSAISALKTSPIFASTEATENSVRENAQSARTNAVRRHVNDAVSRANLANQVTDQMRGIFESIGGILEQVTDPAAAESASTDRQRYLEREANDLLDEAKRVVQVLRPDGETSPENEEIRSDVERKLKQTLDALFPEKADSGFGVGRVDFSTKEAIIDTVANVQKAQKQIEELSDSVHESTQQIRLSANFTEVALQNSEAAQSSVRDLDSALKLAYRARQGISGNPAEALGSVGSLGERSINLLKT